MTVFHTPMITLSDGNLIPQIGLGVLRIDDEGVTPVVESALEAGYRHIDGAAGYNNEAGVGRALQNAGFTQGENRKNLWVTTKLRDSEQGYDSARKAFDRQLDLLQLDYVDMYMRIGPPRSIGVPAKRGRRSTSSARRVACVRLACAISCRSILSGCIRKRANIRPSTRSNCIPRGSSARWWRIARRTISRSRRIRPMARGADLNAGDGVIERIARAHGVTEAQVILRWHIENGTIIIPKSVHADRQRQNLDLFGFVLDPDEHAAIDALDGPTRAGHDPMTFTYA